MLVVVPKQAKEPTKSCNVFSFFLRILIYFVSGWTLLSPACRFLLPQVQEPPPGRKNLKNLCSNNEAKAKLKKIYLSSPSAWRFLLPQPVWGADAAYGENEKKCFWSRFWKSLSNWVNIYYSTTWLVSAGPSTAAPRAPRPSPMIPPSIAAFPVEKI